ncbi:hypothetical protein GP486_004519 [Trichoglossum hirsutum]|uniref:Uncharacterized protein n=1 Tax=Trichoglossum hirsutum TaxID=265104 RepID=A0A9P8LAU3_9PEZI|nr:hypothetical protein GP486_004519 [Trichoglossum hirsutum]
MVIFVESRSWPTQSATSVRAYCVRSFRPPPSFQDEEVPCAHTAFLQEPRGGLGLSRQRAYQTQDRPAPLFNVLDDIAVGIKENNKLLRYVAGLPQAPERSPTPSNSGDEADRADDDDEGSSSPVVEEPEEEEKEEDGDDDDNEFVDAEE